MYISNLRNCEIRENMKLKIRCPRENSNNYRHQGVIPSLTLSENCSLSFGVGGVSLYCLVLSKGGVYNCFFSCVGGVVVEWM